MLTIKVFFESIGICPWISQSIITIFIEITRGDLKTN